ncbi:hypothetical protein M426DRAFT_190832 [Hypoxylon sp. CI-4A]|nr:hypothetical protein M426DRAFT_190832 [Hypoxylon sp. CI-4A]
MSLSYLIFFFFFFVSFRCIAWMKLQPGVHGIIKARISDRSDRQARLLGVSMLQ